LIGERTIFLPPTTAFHDFVAYEEEVLASEAGQQAQQYWQAQLASPPPALQLPTTQPRPAKKSYQGATFSYELDEIVLARVRTVAQNNGIELETFLLAGYATLLERLSGQSDLVIGITRPQQKPADMDWLIGSAENLLPLRLTFPPENKLDGLLYHIQGKLNAANTHQSITYSSLLRTIKLPRSLAQTPLIQTVFNFAPMPQLGGFSNIKASLTQQPKLATNFDLVWNVHESESELIIEADYNSDILDAPMLETWVKQYEAILEEFALAPTQLVNTIVPAAAQIEQAIVETRPVPPEWNQTDVHYPSNVTLVDLFAMQVQETPNALAISAENKQGLTFSELGKKSDQLAAYLRSLKLADAACIGVCFADSADVATALLGIAKAGYTFVPIDPAWTKQAIEAVSADANLALMLSEADLFTALKLELQRTVRVILLDYHWLIIAHHNRKKHDNQPATKNSHAGLLYALHDGQPQGTILTHSGLANILMSLIDNPGIEADDVLLSLSPLSNPFMLAELFMPLLMGAQVILASAATISQPDRLAHVLTNYHVTMLQAPESIWQAFVASGWQGQADLTMLIADPTDTQLIKRLIPLGKAVYGCFGSAESGI
ncbi:MAG TPA: hypothetical protein ENJ56_02035, partial [Anaerolineae bacterium]|nr:hypothetical protein [Anaerolineae bacterium]